jgi:hypothetical protein
VGLSLEPGQADDGQTTTLNPATSTFPVQKRNQARSFLEVQFQQDMHGNSSASARPFIEFVDAVSLKYW